MSAYILDSRVVLTGSVYAVTCFDGSVVRLETDGPDGLVVVFEDGSTETCWETTDEAIRSLIGEPQ